MDHKEVSLACFMVSLIVIAIVIATISIAMMNNEKEIKKTEIEQKAKTERTVERWDFLQRIPFLKEKK